MRLFLAIALDRGAETAIGQLLGRMPDALGEAARALRWTPASNVHLTLHFLGEVDEAGLARLRAALGATLPTGPFPVRFDRADVHPPAGPPRVVWLSADEGRDRLIDLQREVGRRIGGAGFAVETRPFSPHLTLARVRDRERRRARSLREAVAAIRIDAIGWVVERVTLFRSDLSGAAPRYETLHDIRLST